MITTLGKELKKLRIDLGINLVEMARELKISSAYLSAIETGKKRVPETFLQMLAQSYPQIDGPKFDALINQSRKEVRLELVDSSFGDVVLATALARKFKHLSEQQKEELKQLLS